MAIRGPAYADPPFVDDRQSVCIRQSQILIRKFSDECGGTAKFGAIEWTDSKIWQSLDKRQELYRAVPIVTPQEPTVSFSND